MEPPSLAIELRKLLLWLTLACFSLKFVRKQIDWTGKAGSCSQNDRNGRGFAPKWVWEIFVGVNFRGFADKRLSAKLDPRNKYDCTVYNGYDRPHPRKLNRENFGDWPSAKIGPHENFPLYGTSQTLPAQHLVSFSTY
jgi:hypothetical protein